MSKKRYNFNYDYYKAEVSFEVDLEVFTPEFANETLTYFTWSYDKEADPIDEVMKKYAMRVLNYISGEGGLHSVYSLKKEFNVEGFGHIDGSMGITLLDYSEFEFDEGDLEMEVVNV